MDIKEKLLLKTEDFKPYFDGWNINGIFNPGAIRGKDGKIILYVRVAEAFTSKNILEYPVAIPGNKFSYVKERVIQENFASRDGNVIFLNDKTVRLSNISHFRKVILDKSGFNVLEIKEEPYFYPTELYEEFGVEDPRIVKINGKFIMSYVSVSRMNGISSSIAVSKDLKKWKKLGIAFCHENKDVVLFPEKINGEYAALHRPVGCFNFSNPSVWISYSKDLKYWGKDKCIFKPRIGSWDEIRVGSGTPPIKTKKGWLLIYHGVKGKNYSAGAILLDLKNPEKVLARTGKKKPILIPNSPYEKEGFVDNVVFPTGIVEDLDKKSVLIFCGASDKYIVVKKIKIEDILESMEKI